MLRRVRAIFAPAVEEEVDRELGFHLEMRARELEEAGWSAVEARAEAERVFGDYGRVARSCRDLERRRRTRRRRVEMFQSLTMDLRLAARTLRRSPTATLVAVLTLALGAAAISTLWAVVHGVLLRPLPYPRPGELVALWETAEDGRQMAVAHPNFADWRDRAPELWSGIAVHPGFPAETTVRGSTGGVTFAERLSVAAVSEELFTALEVGPRVGRRFVADELRAGGTPAALVSDAFWRRRLGGVRDLSAATLSSRGKVFQVVGVMPPGFDFPTGTDVWVAQELWGPGGSRTAHNWQVVARLAPGVTRERAARELDHLAARLQEEHPGDNDAFGVAVVELRDQLVGPSRRPLLLLLGAAATVLLVACANLASTLLARALARHREMAVRSALGAGSWRLVRQLLVETLLLGLVAGGSGLVATALVLRALAVLRPAALPRLDEIALDGPVVAAALAAVLATTLLFGLLPARRAIRGDLVAGLGGGTRGASGRRGTAWNLLIGTEAALAVVLLAGAALLVADLRRVLAVDPGFDPRDVVAVDLEGPEIELGATFDPTALRPQEEAVGRFHQRLLETVAALPGVETVGLVNQLPLSGKDANGTFFFDGSFAGRAAEDSGYASYRVASPDYFAAMDVPLLRGRTFSAAGSRDGEHEAVVNQTLAERYWPNGDPIGERVRFVGMDLHGETWLRIVGVVGDVRHDGLAAPSAPELYVALSERPFRAQSATLVVESVAAPGALVPVLRELLRERHPGTPAEIATMPERLAASVAAERFTALVLAVFSLLALGLAATGIYGVVAYSVASRRRELGIRLALGARPEAIVAAACGGVVAVVAVGALAGVVLAAGLGDVLASQLHDVAPRDPTSLAVAVLVLLVAAVAAAGLPARRATRIDPAVTLREE